MKHGTWNDERSTERRRGLREGMCPSGPSPTFAIFLNLHAVMVAFYADIIMIKIALFSIVKKSGSCWKILIFHTVKVKLYVVIGKKY